MNRRRLGSSLAAGCLALSATRLARAETAGRGLDEPHLAVVRSLLDRPEGGMDLTDAKLAIDRLIDTGIDMRALRARLDAMANDLVAWLPTRAPSDKVLAFLRRHNYEPTPWNGHRPFRYDLNDPTGTVIRNKLLSTYLETRQGNCISMPLLFVILGRRLGLDLSLATAPNHVLVKYRDDAGRLHNLEATSGAGFTREAWLRQQLPMTDQSLALGTYLRPLNRKESVVLMAGTLLEWYAQQGREVQRIAMARLVLPHDPSSVPTLLHLYGAHQQQMHALVRRYGPPERMAPAPRQQAVALLQTMQGLFDRAWAIGWRPLEAESGQPARRAGPRVQPG